MEYFDDIKISEILVKKVAETITEDEQRILNRWLADSSQNQKIYDKFMSGEFLTNRRLNLSHLNNQHTIDRINVKINRHNMKRLYGWVSSVAAVLIVGVVLAISFYDRGVEEQPMSQLVAADKYQAIMSFDDGSSVVLSDPDSDAEWQRYVNHEDTLNSEKVNTIRIEVQKGKEYKIRLSDGTQVWLNAETVIEYPDKFTGARRDVRLSGEAFFDVQPDSERPFAISTPENLTVTVLGTRFNVQNYDDVQNIQVTLVEGSVSVVHADSHITLSPNQQAVLDRSTGGLSVHKVENMSSYTAWIDGMFAFTDQPLSVVIDAVAKWYNLDVVYESRDVNNSRYMTFHANRNESVNDVLSLLELTTGLKYRIEGHTIYIRN